MESNFDSEGGVPAQQAGMKPQSFLTQMKTEKDIESKKEGPFVSGAVEKYVRSSFLHRSVDLTDFNI